MGFYGNISNTSKTTFSFDLIYNSRVQMEENMTTDGVFLGRYVLIQYDQPPIKAYYRNQDEWMYNSPTFDEHTKIKNPVSNQLYQDIGNINSEYGFYYFKKDEGKFVGVGAVDENTTPYAFYFRQDVSAYGRGYDATVWMKQFDPENGTYKYVMLAELNAVVPTFHLVLDPPTETPVAPYFDRDTTNIDYYLHQQPQYGTRIAEVKTDEYGNPLSPTDEKIKRKTINWKIDPETGLQVWEEENPNEPNVYGDIYYNKAGFDYVKRSEDTTTENKINYNYAQSGRLYGGDPNSKTVYDQLYSANDIHEWYFRLPAIGNSICHMWDKVYGVPANGEKRYLNLSQQTNDTKEHLVTYDKTTLMGTINTVRDMFGYHLIDKSKINEFFLDDPDSPEFISNTIPKIINEDKKNAKVRVNIEYQSYDSETPDKDESQCIYNALDCLYWEIDEHNDIHYYYYAYQPKYEQVNKNITSLDKTLTYYTIDDSGVYKLANIGLWPEQGSDEEKPLFYTRTDAWKISELSDVVNKGIYALLVNIHTILGTNAENERSLTTIQGAINCMKDLLGSINPDLKPGRLLHTNVETGQIEVTDTYFPSSDSDSGKVLAGNGEWVNRFSVMTLVNGKSHDVNNLEGSEYVRLDSANENHENNFNITTGNKWIRIAGDSESNTVTFGHLVQSISNNENSNQAFRDYHENDRIFINHNDSNTEEFITQKLSWDEAGHITKEFLTTHQLPMSYKTFSIGANADKVEPEMNTGSVIADTTLDELQLAPGNKWVNIAAYDSTEESVTPDTIKFSHTLSGVTAGSYGLAADETITSLNTDNKFEVPYLTIDEAGHVTAASTETVTIPENFENVTLTVAADNAVDELIAKAGSFKPTALTDTFTFATTNKWIRANADTANRKISLAHRLTSITSKTGTINQNTSDTFETYDFAFDEAGHVIEKTTRTITIPNAFKQFAVGAISTAVNDSAGHTAGICEPDVTHDTLTLYPGNKWIHIAANRAGTNSSTDDSITFGHSVYYSTSQTSENANETPNFGVTFKVPHFTVDEAGHVNNIASHTVKIPLPSLTDNNSTGNVVTSVTLAPATGAITIGRNYIGSLALTGYTSAATTPTAKNVTASDSLNVAIKKLEQQVIDEASTRSSEDNTLTTNLNTEIENREKAIEQEIKDRNDAIKVETDARKQAITDEETARNTAITNAINTEVTNRDTAINTAISELVNGAPEALDTLKELSDALAQGDTNLSTTITNLKTSVDAHLVNYNNPHKVTADQIGLGTEALNSIINSAVESVLGNFTVSLAEPEVEIITVPETGTNLTRVTVNVIKFADTTTIRWEKQLDSGEFAAIDPAPADPYTINTPGVYQYFLIREYMGRTEEFKSQETYTLI